MPRVSDKDPLNHTEMARILGISAIAAVRQGQLTTAQKRKIDRIIDRAEQREAKKAARKKAA